MYFFKETERAKLLQGRTIKYIAENKVFLNQTYLCSILSGRHGCSKRTAMSITKSLCLDANLEDYFYEDNNKPVYTRVNKNN